MDANAQSASIDATASTIEPPRSAWSAHARWWLALLITLGPALYACVRTLIVRMAHSRPEWETTLILAGSLLLSAMLTWRLKDRLSERWSRGTWPVVLSAWALCCGLGIAFASTGSMSRLIVASLFVLGTLWVPWLGWIRFDATSIQGLAQRGLAALAGLGVLGSTLTVSEMRGDNTVSFRWMWSKPHDFELPPPQLSPASLPSDGFTPTSHDFPGYLGRQRTGVIEAAEGLATDWASRPPVERWRKTVGPGWSGFAVMGEYAVTQEQRGDDEYVVCYRIADGDIAWSVSSPGRFESTMGGAGPRATPSIAPDGRVYTVGGTGALHCIDGRSGQVQWNRNILDDNGGSEIAHGVCGSPLIDGDRVIVAPTGNQSVCLAAYDRFTGNPLWQSGRHAASYSSPTIVELAGRRQLLLHAAVALEAHDAATGEFLWEFEWTNEYDNNCSQPIVVDPSTGRLVVTSGYGRGAALIEVQPSGASWTVNTVWTSREMSTKFTTAIRIGDSVYGLDNGILACIDLATGQRRWKSGRYQHGQILLVGKVLLVQAENGDLALVDPRPREFIELARIPLLDNKTWNNPAVAGRFILLRNSEEAVCLEWPMATERN
jgi:outer membrane protein assembly factor BamB